MYIYMCMHICNHWLNHVFWAHLQNSNSGHCIKDWILYQNTNYYILKDLYLQVEIISLCASSACRNGFSTRIPASTARKFISWWPLCAVFPDLPTAGATLNPRQFRKSQPQFLGHFLDKDGNWANPDKTPAIAKVSPLTNVSELWQFMGLVNQLADLTQPLR